MAHRSLKAEVGVEQAADQDADEQGGVDLLGNQRQGNGDDRGQQGPDGVVEIAGGFYISRSLASGAQEGAAAGLTGLILPIAGHAQAGGAAVGTLDHLAARFLRRVPGSHGSGAHGKQQHHRHRQQGQQTARILSHGVLSFARKKSHDVVMTSSMQRGNHDSAPPQGDDSLRDLLPQPGPKDVRPALRTSANTPFPSPAGLGIRGRLLFVAAPLSHLSHHGIISCRNVNPFSGFSCFSPRPPSGPAAAGKRPPRKAGQRTAL